MASVYGGDSSNLPQVFYGHLPHCCIRFGIFAINRSAGPLALGM